MPLHLLGKKSWNVYDPKNIARVRKDEAEAAAREAEEERRMQDVDNERRVAILRGETPPPLPNVDDNKERKWDRRDERAREDGGQRKRRRLAGEDDTERDIRLAREDLEVADGARERLGASRKKAEDGTIVDRDGLMALFPEEVVAPRSKASQRAEEDAAKTRREKEQEERMSMRFVDAAGKNKLKQDPWYKTTSEIGATATEESKDVWGRPDPKRKDREQARIASNDPFTAMQQAQKQLKQAKSDKAEWDERQQELKRLRREAGRRQRESEKKRRRSDDADSLEGFSLGDSALSAPAHDRSETSHRAHRSRDRSRERVHHRHHRNRDRSKERGQKGGKERRQKSRSRSRELYHHHEQRRRRSRGREPEDSGVEAAERYPLIMSPPHRRAHVDGRREKSATVASRMIAAALGMKPV